MAINYKIEFKDVININHVINITDGLLATPVLVNGTAVLQYGEANDVLDVVRSQGLKVNLQANRNRNFEELSLVNNQEVEVKYYRDGVLIFDGYIDPQGYYEDFINDEWFVSLNCVDGLGYLKELAFVDNTTGSRFIGKMTQKDVLVYALKRLNKSKNIYIYINIIYDGLITLQDITDFVYINTERYIKDDSDTIMDCMQVIEDILETYCAILISHGDSYYIVQPTELFDNSEINYFEYSSEGVYLGRSALDYNLTIGSEINGFYPHHAGSSISLTNERLAGAFRVVYDYGFTQVLNDNKFIISNSGVINGFTINDATYLTFPSNEEGVILNAIDDGVTKTLTTDIVTLSAGDKLNINTGFTTRGDAVYLKLIVFLNGATNYYLDEFGSWTTTPINIKQFNGQINPNAIFPEQRYIGTDSEIKLTIECDPLPVDGDLEIQIFTPNIFETGGDAIGELQLNLIEIIPIEAGSGITSETHTFKREGVKSSYVLDNKKVSTGDNPSDVYNGTIYEVDQTTPTTTWSVSGAISNKKLIVTMGILTMRLKSAVAKEYNGNIFGFFRYQNVIQFDGIDGFYLLTKYNYNILENQISITANQIFNDKTITVDAKETFNDNDNSKPTIVN